jgi:hypothetical protein
VVERKRERAINMANRTVQSIKKIGDYWYVNYCIEQEAFVESDNSHLIETTEQYGFLRYDLTGTLKINVDKVLADGNVDVEGLRLIEALYHLMTSANADIKQVYNELALNIDNDSEWYTLCQTLEAGE